MQQLPSNAEALMRGEHVEVVDEGAPLAVLAGPHEHETSGKVVDECEPAKPHC